MVNICFTFELGFCNGNMHMDILVNDNVCYQLRDSQQSDLLVDLDVPWPSVLQFCLTNKNMKTDTEIDQQGAVVKDKYIRVRDIAVGKFPLLERVIYDVCDYIPHNQQPCRDIYWAYPGTVTMTLDQASPMHWHLKHKNMLFFRNT